MSVGGIDGARKARPNITRRRREAEEALGFPMKSLLLQCNSFA
jgi:hypothetical protein